MTAPSVGAEDRVALDRQPGLDVALADARHMDDAITPDQRGGAGDQALVDKGLRGFRDRVHVSPLLWREYKIIFL
jgi:hypothetical protein